MNAPYQVENNYKTKVFASTAIPDDGEPCGLKWRLTTSHGPLAFALPCNVPQVFHLLTQDRILVRDVEARKRQATRVAWRILKDWTEAQLALLDTGMVELEEIFLPYMLQDNQTLYHALREGNFRALQSD